MLSALADFYFGTDFGSGAFPVNFEQISHIDLVFPLVTLNK